MSSNEIVCLHLCLLSLSYPDYGRYISKRKSTFRDRCYLVIFGRKQPILLREKILNYLYEIRGERSRTSFSLSCENGLLYLVTLDNLGQIVRASCIQTATNRMICYKNTTTPTWYFQLNFLSENIYFPFFFRKIYISSEMEAILNLRSVLSLG